MPRATALVTAALAVLGVVAGAASPASAADEARSATVTATVATGHDVSYPQCGATPPTRRDIAVVGVNAGTGTATNPCLAEQLAWGDAPGTDGTPQLADVYVNTANPGHLGGWWPRSDLTRAGLPVSNPEGACIGAEDAACAYVYGWSIATDDALHRGVSSPGDRMWWLDVETMNTWSWNRAANLAVLEGMTDAFRGIGGSVGIYSTARQWAMIVGSTAPSSTLAGAPSWVAGAVTRGGAEENCARTRSFTPGGRVAMAQWVEGAQDHDVSCVAGVTGGVPGVEGDAAVGGRLVAQPGRWGPDGVRLSYQWLSGGFPIAGATAPAYVPAPSDLGAVLTVRVTGDRLDAPSLALTSAGTVVMPPADDTPSGTPTTAAPASPAPSTSPGPATDASAAGSSLGA